MNDEQPAAPLGVTQQIQIGEVVINPTWSGHLIAISDHGDNVLLTFEHPRHGTIRLLYSRTTAGGLRDWLALALAQPILRAQAPPVEAPQPLN